MTSSSSPKIGVKRIPTSRSCVQFTVLRPTTLAYIINIFVTFERALLCLKFPRIRSLIFLIRVALKGRSVWIVYGIIPTQESRITRQVCPVVLPKSHMDCPGIEPGLPQGKACN